MCACAFEPSACRLSREIASPGGFFLRAPFHHKSWGWFSRGGHMFVTTIDMVCAFGNFLSYFEIFLRMVVFARNAQYFYPLVPIPTFRYILSHWVVSLIVCIIVTFFSRLWQPTTSYSFASVFRWFLFRCCRCVLFSAYRFASCFILSLVLSAAPITLHSMESEEFAFFGVMISFLYIDGHFGISKEKEFSWVRHHCFAEALVLQEKVRWTGW